MTEPNNRPKLDKLLLKARTLQVQIMALQEEQRNEVSRPLLRQSVGKCFKYSNSYGDGKRWTLYCQIIGFDEKKMTFETVQFQHTSRDGIEIELRHEYNFDGRSKFEDVQSWEPITNWEYSRAKKALLKTISRVFEVQRGQS